MQQQYLGIIRDAKNVTVNAVHFSASSGHEAELVVKGFTNPNRDCNGYLESERIKKYKCPFRYNVGQK